METSIYRPVVGTYCINSILYLTNLATPQWASVGFIFYFFENFFGRENKFQTFKKNWAVPVQLKY
ncbi:hypothetical protein [Spiroplasma endosymbiont of Acasis viretata]|uniref:hypothetical protein n=1 Tax=Spiroplasma endosymbiont of Acasis viretata TaxID=3066306 RepID=UPI00313CF290